MRLSSRSGGTRRQQAQRAVAWAMYTTLGASENAHRTHALLCDIPEAADLRAALQDAIVALNAAAELAEVHLHYMKEENHG